MIVSHNTERLCRRLVVAMVRRPSVRLSVCHASVFYQNGVSKDREIFTVGSRNDSVLKNCKNRSETRTGSRRSAFYRKGCMGKIGDLNL